MAKLKPPAALVQTLSSPIWPAPMFFCKLTLKAASLEI
ncbi:Unknown protein sequence [Pseudomonas syringae pv. maculicola]|nr:Unknown protein sequence [Pseudomonas savastanoi pv. phaseolicola]KPB39237.1 Unknown protein sequence [Pseudomonas savastanoi pv. phaseolicola]KPB41643.1 Unknown protein sequence [Pseudomonas savastanoi pv. phaseolicola]KPB85490.1 Unknown protein sequence [Pseudomonas syringae pv. maculicola]